jgi:hypothetical protein
MILDEWLEARHEALDAVILGEENSLAGYSRRALTVAWVFRWCLRPPALRD